MIRRAGLLLLLVCPMPALAGNCANLKTIAELAEAGFATGPPDITFIGADSCDVSRNDDGSQTYLCSWQFAYRTPGATAVFDMLERTIPVCIRGAKALPADDGVNHPDSYDLRRFQRGGVVISTSLKDKAERDQTLVFLRVDTE